MVCWGPAAASAQEAVEHAAAYAATHAQHRRAVANPHRHAHRHGARAAPVAVISVITIVIRPVAQGQRRKPGIGRQGATLGAVGGPRAVGLQLVRGEGVLHKRARPAGGTRAQLVAQVGLHPIAVGRGRIQRQVAARRVGSRQKMPLAGRRRSRHFQPESARLGMARERREQQRKRRDAERRSHSEQGQGRATPIQRCLRYKVLGGWPGGLPGNCWGPVCNRAGSGIRVATTFYSIIYGPPPHHRSHPHALRRKLGRHDAPGPRPPLRRLPENGGGLHPENRRRDTGHAKAGHGPHLRALLCRPAQSAACAAGRGAPSRWRTWLAVAVAVWGLREGVGAAAQAQVPTELRPPGAPLAAQLDNSQLQMKVLVEGTVTDGSTHEGLPSVTVSLKDTKIWCSTKADGTFQLAVPKEQAESSFTITASFVGFETKQMAVIAKTGVPVVEVALALNTV
ncbi:carboxypeptidase-like regulatory domain-containing protein [Hymenobacter nivis]|uniref:Carboxypeptidase-like regulatory domain-containing protein n=2 Tax=Hymenobacter nivis TaxID=1850093 RepID=A0A502GP52_9BACT|nr:carboxypeptidase-like regulatory domain-containing protein [Hymenobacter nivis]